MGKNAQTSWKAQKCWQIDANGRNNRHKSVFPRLDIGNLLALTAQFIHNEFRFGGFSVNYISLFET